jgi:hypothetical protein
MLTGRWGEATLYGRTSCATRDGSPECLGFGRVVIISELSQQLNVRTTPLTGHFQTQLARLVCFRLWHPTDMPMQSPHVRY